MKTVQFFGLPIQSLQPQECELMLRNWLVSGPHWLVTVNPEMLLRAWREPSYEQLISQADALIPDGFGVVLWSRGLISHRYPGVELTESVMNVAQEKHQTVLCLVSSLGLSSAEEVRRAAIRRWPELALTVMSVDPNSSPSEIELNLEQVDVVLVNFGVPAQDEWLGWMKKNAGGWKLGIGVGGTFDYWTGKTKRAPQWVRRIGFEWLWRVVWQPWRTIRIWNALVVFSWYALWDKPVALEDKP